jgi:hypothetical protein
LEQQQQHQQQEQQLVQQQQQQHLHRQHDDMEPDADETLDAAIQRQLAIEQKKQPAIEEEATPPPAAKRQWENEDTDFLKFLCTEWSGTPPSILPSASSLGELQFLHTFASATTVLDTPSELSAAFDSPALTLSDLIAAADAAETLDAAESPVATLEELQAAAAADAATPAAAAAPAETATPSVLAFFDT